MLSHALPCPSPTGHVAGSVAMLMPMRLLLCAQEGWRCLLPHRVRSLGSLYLPLSFAIFRYLPLSFAISRVAVFTEIVVVL